MYLFYFSKWFNFEYIKPKNIGTSEKPLLWDLGATFTFATKNSVFHR